MNLLVQRQPVVDRALPGDLFVDGVRQCFTLENATRKIPAGRYQVAITVSQRALEGELWTPDREYRLPLLMNVPGRTGVRLHAANEFYQLDGCIAAGRTWSGSFLGSSQAAFKPLFAQMLEAKGIWIDVRDAVAQETRIA